MVRFCNVKEGKEVEGAHKGRFTLFLTAVSESGINTKETYTFLEIYNNVFSRALHEAIYIVDKEIPPKEYQGLVNIINLLLTECTVSLETSSLPICKFQNNLSDNFNYIYRVDALYGIKRVNIPEIFIKFENKISTCVVPIANKIYSNLNTEIKDDVQLLPG